jgi:anti-anti-sigma factor
MMLEIRTAPGRREPLVVTTGSDAESYIVALEGELDIATVALVQAAFRRAEASAAPEIVVDLSSCGFVDSTGIGALLSLNRRLSRAVGRDLVILPGPPAVQRVFATCGLLDVLPFPE